MRALVVDDSKVMRALLRRTLMRRGYEVDEASNGQEAILVMPKRPDVVFVDWHMPVMDGLQFVREVRADRSYDGVLLMMVSSESEQAKVVTALEAGADDYLMKPQSPEALDHKLDALRISR